MGLWTRVGRTSGAVFGRVGVMRQGFRRRAPGRHRASREPDRPLWRRPVPLVGAALVVLLALVVPWLWQSRPFDPRHGFGPDYPPAGIGAAQAPIGAPPKAPGGRGGYAFMQLQADGRHPVAYDPCRPIHVVVSSVGLPEGGEALVREAADVMSQASGLQFVYDGLTDEPPDPDRDPYQPERYGDRWAPVYVAFATPDEVPGLAGGAIGLGGSTPRAASDGLLVYVTGAVWLDRDPMTALLAAGRRDSARAVVEHEIGHVLGLGHVQDSSELMWESGGAVSGPADGDRRGLAILGRGSCRPDL